MLGTQKGGGQQFGRRIPNAPAWGFSGFSAESDYSLRAALSSGWLRPNAMKAQLVPAAEIH